MHTHSNNASHNNNDTTVAWDAQEVEGVPSTDLKATLSFVRSSARPMFLGEHTQLHGKHALHRSHTRSLSLRVLLDRL